MHTHQSLVDGKIPRLLWHHPRPLYQSSTNLGNTNHTNTLFDQCVLFPRNTWQDWPLRNVDFLSSTNPTWASVHNYTSVQTSVHNYTSAKQMSNQGVCRCSRAEWPLLISCPPGIRCRLRTFTGADAPDAFFNVRPETSRPRHPMQFKNSTFSINWIPHPGAFFVVPQEIQPQLKSIIRSGPSSSIFCQEMKIWHFIAENLDLIISYCSQNCAQFLHRWIYTIISIAVLFLLYSNPQYDNNNIRT